MPGSHSWSNASSSDSDNDDAPESISLSESKKDLQTLESKRRDAQVAQRRARKDKNRETDRKLKERAVMNRNGEESFDRNEGGGKGVEKKKKKKGKKRIRVKGEQSATMQEAEAERVEEVEWTGIHKGRDDDHDKDDSAAAAVERHPLADDHLPDELFTAAFRSSSKRKIVINDDGGDDSNFSRPEKKKRNSKNKDVITTVIGSREIRILSNPSAPLVPSTTPSSKINKFLNNTLALEDGMKNLRTRGWERRPVNIGVLKRDGPPVSFVRDR